MDGKKRRKRAFLSILMTLLMGFMCVPVSSMAENYFVPYDSTYPTPAGMTRADEGDYAINQYFSVGDKLYGQNSHILYVDKTDNAITGISTVSIDSQVELTEKNGTDRWYYRISGSGQVSLMPVEYCTVTFDLNGHGNNTTQKIYRYYDDFDNSNVYYKVPKTNAGVILYSDSYVAEPNPAPTATGYDFGGWFKEPECTNAWDFTAEKVTADTTIYAKWTAKNFTVRFVNEDGTELESKTCAYGTVPAYTGEALTKAMTEEKIYTFAGWSNGTDTYAADLPAVTGDTTYTAVFSETDNTNEKEGQQQITEGYTNIDDNLIEIGLDTEDKIKDAMFKVVVDKDPEYAKDNVKAGEKIYDVDFVISIDGGNTWTTVTPENFPAEGLDVVLPYPEGVDKDAFEFSVVHMFVHEMNGHKPGECEVPTVTKTEGGLLIRVTGLSPVYVTWRLAQTQVVEETVEEEEPVVEPAPVVIVEVPKTGSNNMLMVWTVVAVITGAAAVSAFVYYRKRRNN